MKISFITFWGRSSNVGTTLQLTSLYEKLKDLGHEPELIRYEYLKDVFNFKSQLLILIKNVVFAPAVLRRYLNYKRFYLLHSPNMVFYKNFSELKKNPPKADVYMAGSDVLWHPNRLYANREVYYLGFTNSPHKMSYATSLGVVLNTNELLQLKEKISDFRYISVRERISKEQLISVGIEHVENVLDPVFLMPKSYYISEISEQPKPLKGRKYLLVYSVKRDFLMDEIVIEIAKRENLKIVLVGGFVNRLKKYDIYDRSAGPTEILNYINNAEIVITNSFHGTAMSIILNKTFIVVMPKLDEREDIRISNILEIAGLKDRIATAVNDIESISKGINYNEVNRKMGAAIELSEKYLKNCLDSFERKLQDDSL